MANGNVENFEERKAEFEQKRREGAQKRGGGFKRNLQQRAEKRLQKARQRRKMANPPNVVEYFLALMIAALNDLVDIVGLFFAFTGVALVIVKILDIGTAVILISWAFMRGARKPGPGGRVERGIKKWIFTFIIELIPFIGEISPTWTIRVVLSYLEHRKIYRTGQRQQKPHTRQTHTKERLASQHEEAQYKDSLQKAA